MTAKGVVACGHPITADVAVDVLQAGGNAVDALVAAGFASFVCEIPLTGIGGGGYMMVHHPQKGSELLDFFVSAPGLGLPAPSPNELHFEDVEIDFGPTTQTFHIGYGASAVPGNPSGLVTAHERWGSIPLAELVQPSIRLAREGFPLTDWGEIMFGVLGPIITYTPEIAQIFAPGGRLMRQGDRFAIPDLANVLEQIARHGSDGFYRGEIGQLILNEVNNGGGRMTEEDLSGYRTIVRKPIVTSYRGHKIELTPGPSLGGTLIGLSLAVLEKESLVGLKCGSTGLIRALKRAMDVTNFIRTNHFPREEISPHFFDQISAPDQLASHLSEYKSRSAGNTTHISVLDGDGLIASCTNSYGEGCGHIVPGTGLELNNMLGEEDLNPYGFHKHPPGARLPSMMCPLAVETSEGAMITIGSGGSNRIRTALLQVLVHILDCGLPLAQAIDRPRMHWENGVLQAEAGIGVEGFDPLEAEGVEVNRWPDLNLFFGGAHGVYRHPDGRLEGAGDPRRFGVYRTA